MSKIIICLVSLMLVVSCNTEELFDGPNRFNDDFESYDVLDDLMEEDDTLWSFAQITRDENSIVVDSSKSFSGNQSMKFTAMNSGESASKSSIVKQKMAFWNGETVRIEAHYYLEGTDSLQWLFLLDLEEQTSIGAGPGMRLALVDDQLRVEHKFFVDDILQSEGAERDFPRDQWVEIIWEVGLSDGENGFVKLWQDGELILEKSGNRTLPRDLLYFQQGTKGMYSSIEIGITANTNDKEVILWVDDFYIETVE